LQISDNKDQITGKVIWQNAGGIAVTSSPNSSFILTRWQHWTESLAAVACFGWGFLHLGVRNLRPTQCVNWPHKCICQMASKSISNGL